MRQSRVCGWVLVLAAWGCGEGGEQGVSQPNQPPVMTAGAAALNPGTAGASADPGAMRPGNPSIPPSGPNTTPPAQPEPKPGEQPVGPTPMQPEPKPGEPVVPGGYDYEMEQVALDADLVIKSGESLRVGPGVVFTAKAGVKVQVDGMLIVEGGASAKVRFVGPSMPGTPRSWHGIVIGSGGHAALTHVEIAGATYGIHALPGSDFDVEDSEIGSSFKAAVVQSDGSFDRVRFHASGDPTFSPVNEVSIDDVNGTLTILDASPTVTNSKFDGSAALVDMIRVGGNGSPVFDHLHIADAHCAFHLNGGVNNSPRISNTVFERLAYGIMAYATKPIVENSVFRDNAFDVGFCFDAVADNAPQLKNNFYSAGTAGVDPSCFQIGADEPSPAAVPNAAAGPVGL
jgi:hypothetical protein